MSSYDSDDNTDAVFSSAMIDKRRKKRISVRLQDKDGEAVEIKDVISQLHGWIQDQMKSEEITKTTDEIFPLITQIMCEDMIPSMSGSRAAAAFVLSQDLIKYGMINQMMMSFYFLKFVQKNELVIIKDEQDITDEEIQKLERINKASQAGTLGALMGLEPKEIMKQMLKSGILKKEDLEGQGFDPKDFEDESSDKDPHSN